MQCLCGSLSRYEDSGWSGTISTWQNCRPSGTIGINQNHRLTGIHSCESFVFIIVLRRLRDGLPCLMMAARGSVLVLAPALPKRNVMLIGYCFGNASGLVCLCVVFSTCMRAQLDPRTRFPSPPLLPFSLVLRFERACICARPFEEKQRLHDIVQNAFASA